MLRRKVQHQVNVYSTAGRCIASITFDRWINAESYAYSQLDKGNTVTVNGIPFSDLPLVQISL